MLLVSERRGTNSYVLFLLFVLLYALTAWAFHEFVYTDALYYTSFGDRLAADRIAIFIRQQQRWQWTGYVLIPILLAGRIFFPAACLYIAAFIDNMAVGWRDIVKTVLISESVFVIRGIMRLLYFFYHPPQTVYALSAFAPFSIAGLFNRPPDYWRYALQTINLFELLYWLLLAKELQRYTRKRFGASLIWVAKSYGLGLFIWILVITYLLIQLD